MTAAAGEGDAFEGSAVLLVDALGRVLLQQRDDDLPPAGVGRWAIPGGGREGNESILETALREFEEETGVGLRRVRHAASFVPGRAGWSQRATIHVFVAQDDVAEEAIEVNEGLAFAYRAPEAAMDLRMNPGTERMLGEALASPLYRLASERRATAERWACVLALNRWGRVLVIQPGDAGRAGDWCLPGGPVDDATSPDGAALAALAEVTGQTVDTLWLFRAYTRAALPVGPGGTTHVYFYDPDIDLGDVAGEGDATYVGPGELDEAALADYARVILEEFFVSPAYKALFH